MITADIMTKMSTAQHLFMKDILHYNSKEFVSLKDIENALREKGIRFTQAEVEKLF